MNRLIYIILLFPVIAAAYTLPLLDSPEKLDADANGNDILFVPEDKKTLEQKQKFPVHWGGHSLTQIKKEIDGIEITVFQLNGGAWLRHKNVYMKAGMIEILGADALKGYLKKGIVVRDTETGTILTANSGVYDKLEEKLDISGSPVITQQKDNNITVARSEKITRYFNEGRTRLNGDVEVVNNEYAMHADYADMDDKNDTVDIWKNPVVFGKKMMMTGKKISYSGEKKLVTLEEEPAIVSLKEGEDAKPVLITGTVIDYSSENEKTGIRGKAKIYNGDLEMFADQIESTGRENDEIMASGNVQIIDKKDNMHMEGRLLEYFKNKNYLHLTGQPVIKFMEKDSDKVKTVLRAVELERFTDKKEMVARGNVTIEGENFTARGAYATYYEDKKLIYLEGNPDLVRDNRAIRTGRIIINPETGDLTLSEGLQIQ